MGGGKTSDRARLSTSHAEQVIQVFIATGRALRSCVPMGISLCPPFHSIQELSRFPSILPNANSVVEDEIRRNTFYFCYLLDRQQGFANGWAMALGGYMG